MTMNKKWLIVPALAAALLASAGSAGAATPAYMRASWEGGGVTTGSALLKNGVTYVQAGYWESAGLKAAWDKQHERVQYAGWGKAVAVRVGSRTGMLDGKLADLGGEPFLADGTLYVPARFVVSSLGGTPESWDAAHAVFTAKGLQTYASAGVKYGGIAYSVDMKSGRLYATGPSGRTELLAELGSPLYDMVSFDFRKTPGGLVYLTITDVFGEPHANNRWFTLVMKNGMVIRQASAAYYMRYGNNVKMYDGHLLLTDGRTLRIVEDGTGRVTETLDLAKLGGEDDRYLLEGIDDDYLLIRPNGSGLLTYVDRHTGEAVRLYKQLLDEEQRQYAETNDTPYRGDNLVFLKRQGNALLFADRSPLEESDKVYRFELPAAAMAAPAADGGK